MIKRYYINKAHKRGIPKSVTSVTICSRETKQLIEEKVATV